MTPAEKGVLGEQIATILLEKKGYAIVDRRYRTRWGEIDIIAQKERYLVFVEVKTRSLSAIAAPKEWVDAAHCKNGLPLLDGAWIRSTASI